MWINTVTLTWNCRACLQECEETGCVAQRCFPHCNFSSGGGSIDGSWFLQEPLYLQWKQWDCQGNCRYYCMVDREKEREAAGYGPVKYHGKWPFKRVYGIQVCFLTCYMLWQHFLLPITVLWFVLFDMLSISSGACLCSFLFAQPCNAFSWLGVIAHPFIL